MCGPAPLRMAQALLILSAALTQVLFRRMLIRNAPQCTVLNSTSLFCAVPSALHCRALYCTEKYFNAVHHSAVQFRMGSSNRNDCARFKLSLHPKLPWLPMPPTLSSARITHQKRPEIFLEGPGKALEARAEAS